MHCAFSIDSLGSFIELLFLGYVLKSGAYKSHIRSRLIKGDRSDVIGARVHPRRNRPTYEKEYPS